MRKRVLVLVLAVGCVLISAQSFATPMTTCSEQYEYNRAVAQTDFETCMTHSGGNFAYAVGCMTVLTEQLAMSTLIYEACSLIQSGG